jgi:hypothetical protein
VLFLAVGIILGIVFLGVINDIILDRTTLITGSDTLNVTKAVIDSNNINTSYVYQLVGGTDLGGPGNFINFVLTNATVTLTPNTDYVLDASSGSLTLRNTTNILNVGVNASASYNYYEDGYISNSFVKVLLGLLIGIFALSLIAYIISKFVELFNLG